MASGKSIRKNALFEQGCQNWSKISGIREYCCPICGEVKKLEELTLEHAPPSSMGGKEIILTCYKCNNTAGSKIDAQVANQQNQLRLIKGFAERSFSQNERLRLQVEDVKLNVELSESESDDDSGKLNFKILGDINNPEHIKQMREHAREAANAGKEYKFNIQTVGRYNFHKPLSDIGHLKTAFLICTAALGYAFAASANFSDIRQQIQSSSQQIAKFYVEVNPKESASNCILELEQKGIIIVSFSGVIVVLPHPMQNIAVFESSLEEISAGKINKITGKEIPWPENFRADYDNNSDFSFQIVTTNSD